MRILAALILALAPLAALASDWEDRRLFNEGASVPLRILSSTDTSFFAAIVEDFVADNPQISVEYLVSSTAEIDALFRASPADFDLVISSAMDLQLKLANDGLAAPTPDLIHPPWAEWRQSLFAFTSEPATIVLNKGAFDGVPLPQTRQDLIEALRARPDVFRGKVGTYDVRRSGLGYLFATQDARASETFWRLMEVMGGLDLQLYCCSGDMIDDLVSGKILVAYNVLGSYAAGRPEGDVLEIVQPSDFATTMMRTAMVSSRARDPEAAAAFVRHLVTRQAGADGTESSLPPLTSDDGAAANIPLEPALLTYLDRLKRRTFLAEWEDAVIQNR